MKGVRLSTFLTLVVMSAALLGSPVNAQNDVDERKPKFNNSIAIAGFNEEHNEGPLFRIVKNAFADIATDANSTLTNYTVVDASMELMVRDVKVARVPFTADVIRAATEACLGPHSLDEAKTWVQLSWVCRTDPDSPLSKFVVFKDSPELTLTVWFEGDKIREIRALEPIPVPMQRRVRMDAYEMTKETD